MIKEIKIIKIKKDIDFLMENYFSTISGMARAIGITPKVLRDFVVLGKTPHDKTFDVIYNNVKYLMKQVKDAEIYNPSPLWVET